MELRGVLFDLDGTLLDIDMDAFLRRYFLTLTSATAADIPGIDFMGALMAATSTMQRAHPGVTNKAAFDADFKARSGVDLNDHAELLAGFYRDVFPTFADGYGPVPGAREAVETAQELGLKVAVATHPIFPEAAILHRIAWAGLKDIPFDAITTYETMRACKPLPGYFEQTAAMIGCAPNECLMVGDDRAMDLPASAVGMRTFYVGDDPDARPDYRGTMTDLATLLRRLA